VEVLRLLRRRCLAKLRKEVEPAPPEALAAFLPAWQNAGQPADSARPGSPLVGRAGRRWRPAGPDAVYDVVDQLAGAAVPASALETLVLPGRIPGYQPAVLDELTAAGEVVWAGAGGLPSSDGWVVLAPAPAAPLLLPPPVEITMTPVHNAVLEVLAGGGGMFFRMLADRVAGMLTDHDWRGLSDTAVAAAIWDLVWAGRLTNDTLAPLRTVLGSGRPVYDGFPSGPSAGREPGAGLAPQAGPATGADRDTGAGPDAGTPPLAGAISPGDRGALVPNGARGSFPGREVSRRPGRAGQSYGGLRGGGRSGRMGSRRYGRPLMPTRTGPPTVTGRWSLLPDRDPDATRRLHAVAQALLDRHGIVTRGSVVAERVPGGFGAVYPVLRAMEEAGQCRRGYFVEGLGAAQFALPGAVDRMRAMAAAQASIPGASTAVALVAAVPAIPGPPAPGAPLGPPSAPGIPAGPSGAPGVQTAPDWPQAPESLPGGPGAPAGAPGPSGGVGAQEHVPGWPESLEGTPGPSGGAAVQEHVPGWPVPPSGPFGGSPPSAAMASVPFPVGASPGQGWQAEPVPEGPAVTEAPPITVLAAADPANAFGAALAWPPRPGEVPGAHRPGRKAGALVVLSGGDLVLYVERGGKTLLSWTSDPAVLVPAAEGLAAAVRGGALGRLTVERADGTGVYDTPLAQALADAGFRPTPRGLRLRN